MKINSDINILGGLPDFKLIGIFLEEENPDETINSFTQIKTEKSVKRFEKAIKSTFLNFGNRRQELVFRDVLQNEGMSKDALLMLFWNASFNNELLNYINSNVFFPAYYSGRIILKQDEVAACLNELKSAEKALQKWSKSTVELTASKYLTLLKKFNLLEGSASKSIKHPFLSDKLFILFVYWLLSIETKSNILKSLWLQYSFSETEILVERFLRKRFSTFWEVAYTGDKLQIKPLIEYQDIYDASAQS